jgi:hypothetical protein
VTQTKKHIPHMAYETFALIAVSASFLIELPKTNAAMQLNHLKYKSGEVPFVEL